MKLQSKKDQFVIKLNNGKQTQEVKEYYCPDINETWIHFNFAVLFDNLSKDNMLYDLLLDKHSKLPVISFEEWKSLPDFPKPEYDPKDVAFNQRKVVGYELIKTEYWESVSIIAGFILDDKNNREENKKFIINFMKSDTWGYSEKLKEAGVLDIWFKPVYKKETVTLKSGVKLSEEDIAEVKEILNNK